MILHWSNALTEFGFGKKSITVNVQNSLMRVTAEAQWEADFEISNEMIVRLIQSNTDLNVSSSRLLGEGWDFFSFLINDEWVFRIPKRWECADTLVREHSLLPSVLIPTNVPKHSYWILQPKGFQMPIAGYRYLSGFNLYRFSASDYETRHLAEHLGHTLNALHNNDFLPKRSKEDPGAHVLEEREEILDAADPYISTSQRVRIEQLFDTYRVRDVVGDHVVTHNDLGVEHILVDVQLNLVAIIDWANACSANRYLDFSGLWAWGGDSFLQNVFDAYSSKPTASDWSLIRLQGLYYILNQLNSLAQTKRQALFKAARHWLKERMLELGDDDLDHVPRNL